jgi:Uncharacterized protein conserved in bacteria (DUF2334)
MTHPVSRIWQRVFPDLRERIETCIASAGSHANGPVSVFFRADDVGVPGKRLKRLMSLFASEKAPLSLAVVPAWLTRARWKYLKANAAGMVSSWCWYQHGWRHINYESQGKKQEFGPSRTSAAVREDISKGRRRLEALMGSDFYPIFTPPWNRCTLTTLKTLKALGFHAVSRSQNSRPPALEYFPDFQVTVDLHTRKAIDPSADMTSLLEELSGAISTNICGIMIHHQRMNDNAFSFLQHLIGALMETNGIQLVTLKEMFDINNQHRQSSVNPGTVKLWESPQQL